MQTNPTPKQEKFARLIYEGRSQVEAYRATYASSAKLRVVAVEASRLTRHPRVAAQLGALRAQLAGKIRIDGKGAYLPKD